MKKTARGQSVLERLELYLQALDDARELAFLSCPLQEIPQLLETWNEQTFAKRHAFLNEYVATVIVKDRSVKIAL